MNRTTVRLFCVLALVCFGAAGSLLAQRENASDKNAEQARHFENVIEPILTRHCLECHGLTAKKGRLDLTRKDLAFKGGLGGPAIVPGDPDESLLWEYIELGEMPPSTRPQMSDRDKQRLKKWIEDGAIWSKDRIGPIIFSDQRIEPHREFECNDDGNDPGPILVRRLTVPEYIETVRSAVGVDIAREAHRILPPDVRADGFSNTAYNLNIDLGNIEAYAQLARIIVSRMNMGAFVSEFARSRELNDANMSAVISAMGKWLLRGPLDEQEVAAYLGVAHAVAAEGGDFNEAVSFIIEAMLLSPRFLYLIEDQSGDGAVRQVGDFELASRMSYILWGAPPDKELMRAAEAGELSDPRQAEAQVQRMLEDPRAVERSARFIHDWLNLDQLSSLRPDKQRFPQWNEQLAADMREETLAFFKYVAWEQRRPLAELMNAQVTFATPLLASHYGLDRQYIAEFVQQTEPDSATERVTEGLQVLYTFEEGKGDTVRDVSEAGESLNLKIQDPSAVRWSRDGLTVQSPTLIAGELLPHRMVNALRASNAITIEAWVTPADVSQAGPARIVTLSRHTTARNFTLGQEADRFDVRLRTTKTDDSGIPSLSSSSGAVRTAPTHVVYTRHKSGDAVLYVNGQESKRGNVGGDFSKWEDRYQLALVNELSKDRPWQGTLHLAAVYDRALSVTEVQRNFTAGARGDGANAVVAAQSQDKRSKDGLQVLYRFDEGGGDTVGDASGAGEPLNMKIENPSAVEWSSQGLTIKGSALIGTAGAPKRLVEAVKKSQAATLEVWITPADAKQDGPARILTLSSGANERNFTLGQDGDKYDVRFRTTTRDANGMPSLSTPGGVVQPRLTHVVYTRTSTGTGLIYINGKEQRQVGRALDGNLSNWSDGYRLMVGNESSKDRPWKGTLHLAAVYNRALSAEEIQNHFAAGARGDASPALAVAVRPERIQNGLHALYRFNEGGGDTVRDASGKGEPLPLKIDDSSAVTWTPGGLTVSKSASIGTAGPAKRLTQALKKSQAVTLETWVTPANTKQDGPARILTLSSGISGRNFTLGQDGNKYDVRFRTRNTNANGHPSLSSPSGSLETRPTHVVYTRDAGGKAKLYLDGQEAGAREVKGNLSNWSDDFRLMVANETSKDRPWLGTLHLAAVYDRALSIDEVRQNYAAGTGGDEPAALAANAGTFGFGVVRGKQALQAVYRFDEGGGDTIRDQSDVGDPLHLKIENPSAVHWSPGGLTVTGSTLIGTNGPPLRLIEAVKQSQAITLEAWVTPADTKQDGPARILTLSSGSGARNFTLGQEGDKYDVRFRTTTKDQNGLPSISSPSGTAQTQPTHVVYTRGTTGTGTIYINGEEQAGRDVDGNLSNWDSAFRLMLGNESSKDRPWRGTFHYVAIYSRALAPDEIRSQGGELARYDLESVPSRGGLLTQGSVLTMGGDEASMVARGLFVLNDLLCSEVGDPPPCLDVTPVPTKPGLSQRGAAEIRLADSACTGCHSRFEPLAFGLEKFDGIGAYHEKDEHGNVLRDDGAILFPKKDEPAAYKTSAELMDLLADSDRIRETFTLKLTQFALGRPLVETDACHLDKIHKQFVEGGGTYQSLITAIILSDLVRMTRTEKEE